MIKMRYQQHNMWRYEHDMNKKRGELTFFCDNEAMKKRWNFFAEEDFKKMEKISKKILFFIQSKKANIAVDPLLTNPLNSCTKLQISAT